jgi:hypothetical protein
MADITFQCYACNQMLQVGADKAGRKARCSQCGTILTIPALAAGPGAVVEAVPPAATIPAAPKPPPVPGPGAGLDDVEVVRDAARPRRRDDDDYDRPRRREDDDYDRPRPRTSDMVVRRRPPANQWDKVRIGFLLVFIGVCVIAGAFGFIMLGNLLIHVSDIGGRVFIRIGATVIFMAIIAAIVGHVFWLFVSNRQNALAFAIASLAVAGVLALLQIVHMIQTFSVFYIGGDFSQLLTGMLRAAHFMMIAFYLRALAQRFGDRSLESATMLNIILCGCLAGFELLSGIVLMAMAPSLFDFGGISRGFIIARTILFWLGAALMVVVLVFTILAIYKGKKLVDAQAGGGLDIESAPAAY